MTRSLTRVTSRSGSVSPATRAVKSARPLWPMMSLRTEPSLRFASCRTVSMRWTCEARSRTSCLAGAGHGAQLLDGGGGARSCSG